MSSYLSASIQQSILQNYGLTIEGATAIGTGAMSTTMRLMTHHGVLFLKNYKFTRNTPPLSPRGRKEIERSAPLNWRQRIAFTHAVQTFLRQAHFPIPCLLPNKTGETFSASGDQVYAISEFVEGQDYEIAQPTDQLRAAGEMLGRLHQQLHGFQSPIEPPWQPIETEIAAQLKDRLARLRPVVDDSKIHPVSKHQIDRWLEEVERLAKEWKNGRREGGKTNNPQSAIRNPQWIIHGDYRAQNLKFDGERIRAILDLDTARPAERLFDLGYALVFFPAVYQDAPLTSEQQAIFLHAYENTCPLSEAERKLLPSHLKLAFLRGITLWLDLYYFAGMRERTDPWIQSYLRRVDEVVGFQCEA